MGELGEFGELFSADRQISAPTLIGAHPLDLNLYELVFIANSLHG
jgi:hypothetical protein